MTDQQEMLAEYARLFEAVKERWPDAPGLPKHYWICDTTRWYDGWHMEKADQDNPNHPRFVDDDLALCRCAETAMEIAVWWQMRGMWDAAIGRSVEVSMLLGRWCFVVWADGVSIVEYDAESLPAAALAMLRAIVEGASK